MTEARVHDLHSRGRPARKCPTAVLVAVASLALLEGAASAQTGGCPPSQPALVTSDVQAPIAHLTIDEGFIYFFEERGLFRVDKDGGTPEPFGNVVVDVDRLGGPAAFDIAIDASRVYVSRRGTVDGASIDGELYILDKAGRLLSRIGARRVLTPNDCHVPLVNGIALDPSGDLFWIEDDRLGSHLPCDDAVQSRLVRVPKGSAEPMMVNFTEFFPATFIRPDTTGIHIYYGQFEGLVDATVHLGTEYWSALDGPDGGPGTFSGFDGQIVRIFDDVLTELVADERFVYGDARRDGPGAPFNVFRLKANGHGLYDLAKGGGGSLAVDETFLYYLDATGTRLLRTCKLAGL